MITYNHSYPDTVSYHVVSLALIVVVFPRMFYKVVHQHLRHYYTQNKLREVSVSPQKLLDRHMWIVCSQKTKKQDCNRNIL